VADATANAITRIAASIQHPGGLEATNLRVAERYVDAFGELARTNNALIIPANMADIVADRQRDEGGQVRGGRRRGG
jgi:hypothetical protein